MTKRLMLFLAEIACLFIVPLFLIVLQFGSIQSNALKFGFGGIILVLFVFLLFKKYYINKKIDELKAQLVNYKTDYKTETSAERKEKIRKAMIATRTVLAAYQAIMPILYLAALWALTAALEAQIIMMSRTVKWILLSYTVGGGIGIYKARLL